jgi:hypothetical protein
VYLLAHIRHRGILFSLASKFLLGFIISLNGAIFSLERLVGYSGFKKGKILILKYESVSAITLRSAIKAFYAFDKVIYRN